MQNLSTTCWKIFSPLHHTPWPELTQIEIASFIQIPGFQVIGLPGQDVMEARERVRAAIEASGFEFPRKKILIHLTPASVQKRGAGLDLGIALAVLAHDLEEVDTFKPSGRFLAWGELSLGGTIRPCGQAVRALLAAWANQIETLIVAEEEAFRLRQLVRNLTRIQAFDTPPPRICGVADLRTAFEVLTEAPIETAPIPRDLETVRGFLSPQSSVLPISARNQRLLGIAAANGHHLMLIGPKGSGKTQMIEWLEAVFPKAGKRELLLQLALQELHGDSEGKAAEALLYRPIVRRVPPQVRPAALVGSMNTGLLRPGELALAHGGLLIADEFAEWPRDSREALRAPLEQGRVTLARAQYHLEYPADFTFAATANYCPCGGIPREFMEHGKGGPPCRCSVPEQQRYFGKLSGPILDRIDLVINVTGSEKEPMTGESLTSVQERVQSVRENALRLWGGLPGKLIPLRLEEILTQNETIRRSLNEVLSAPSSLRARHKILRVALSLGLWDEQGDSKKSPIPTLRHFTEAALYRPERWTRSG